MVERKMLSSFLFLANWLNFFIEPWKIENAAKYELFLPKPLTLTLFWWCESRLVVLKGLTKAHGCVASVILWS